MVGVTAGELRDFQVKNKLQLPTNVILDTMSMVGVISAGCHVSSESDQYDCTLHVRFVKLIVISTNICMEQALFTVLHVYLLHISLPNLICKL